MKKVYFITGASSEIGVSYLRSLEKRKEPCIVFGQYHLHGEILFELEKVFQYVELHPYSCDLSSSDSVQKMLRALSEQGYCPNHILHLASEKMHYTRVRQFDWEHYLQQMEIQVHSLIEMLKYFLRDMQKQKYGRIVIMLSECTLGTPAGFLSDYVMIKYSLLGMVKSLAVEYGGKGITVNGVSPAMMETKFLSDIDERIIQMNAESAPMKRNATVEETVAAIEFLMSEQASYITGSNLNVSGGRYML